MGDNGTSYLLSSLSLFDQYIKHQKNIISQLTKARYSDDHNEKVKQLLSDVQEKVKLMESHFSPDSMKKEAFFIEDSITQLRVRLSDSEEEQLKMQLPFEITKPICPNNIRTSPDATCTFCYVQYMSHNTLLAHVQESHSNYYHNYSSLRKAFIETKSRFTFECDFCRQVVWNLRDYHSHLIQDHIFTWNTFLVISSFLENSDEWRKCLIGIIYSSGKRKSNEIEEPQVQIEVPSVLKTSNETSKRSRPVIFHDFIIPVHEFYCN